MCAVACVWFCGFVLAHSVLLLFCVDCICFGWLVFVLICGGGGTFVGWFDFGCWWLRLVMSVCC